jgi:septal ring factor EnvC (AmiA/AmiB activator)
MDRTYYRSLDRKTLVGKAKDIGGEIVIALAERLEDDDFVEGETKDLEDNINDLEQELRDARDEIYSLEKEINELNATIMKLEEDTAQ